MLKLKALGSRLDWLPRQTTFRTLLAIAAKQGVMVYQYDVKTAFLYCNLEKEICLRQPPALIVHGQESKVIVL